MNYQNVHSFLRNVVRVDPDRQVAERLKTIIRTFDETTPCLAVCREPTVRHLNTAFLEAPAERPTRPRADFKVEDLEPESSIVAQIACDIATRVEAALGANHPVHLVDILKTLETVPWQEFHLATGIAMQALLTNRDVSAVRDYAWKTIRGAAEIQDIEVQR